jgi:hypothetical protein
MVNKEADSIFEALFDFSFRRFVTPRVVGLAYMLALAWLVINQIRSLLEQSKQVDMLVFLTASIPIGIFSLMLGILLIRIVLELVLSISQLGKEASAKDRV